MNTHTIETIQPQVGYVIVQPIETEAEVNNIIMPKGDTEVPQWGKVIVCGDLIANDDGKLPTISIGVGQTVIYRKWGGNDVTIGEKKYYFLKYEEIIGAVNHEA